MESMDKALFVPFNLPTKIENTGLIFASIQRLHLFCPSS